MSQRFKLKLPTSTKLLPFEKYNNFQALKTYAKSCADGKDVKILWNDCAIDDDDTFEMVKESAKSEQIELNCIILDFKFFLYGNQQSYEVVYSNESFSTLKENCNTMCQCDISQLYYLKNDRRVLTNDSTLVDMISYFQNIPTNQRILFYYSERTFIENKIKERYSFSSIGVFKQGGDNTLFLCNNESKQTIVKIKKGMDLNDLMREFHKTFMLDHPYIVKIIGNPLTETDQNETTFSGYQMPLYEDSLLSLVGQDKFIDEVTFLSIALKLSDAISYIQTRNIIHCDIRPANVFISRKQLLDDSMDYHIVLGDFEYALFVHSIGSEQVYGTPYPAPEVNETKRHSFESDIYSFGLLLLQLACGEISNKKQSMLDRMRNRYSIEITTLVESMLNDQPDQRPKITEIFTQFSKIAILRNGQLLKYVEPELKKNRDFVLQAIENNSSAYQFVDPSLKQDTEILTHIRPFQANPLIVIETNFGETIDFTIKISPEFNQQLDKYKLMDQNQHHVIGIIGNQKVGKSHFLNECIGEPVFKVGDNHQQTTVGIDYVIRKLVNGMTRTFIDCEGFNSIERRIYFEKEISNLLTKQNSRVMNPTEIQQMAQQLLQKFNVKIALLLYRICNVLVVYCNSDNVEDLSFLNELSNVENIDKVEEKPALVILVRQTHLTQRDNPISLEEFSKLKDRVIGAKMCLFSTIQYFAVPNFSKNNFSDIINARSLFLNNHFYFSNMKYFIEYNICPAVELLSKDNELFVDANFGYPKYLLLLKKYVSNKSDQTETEMAELFLINLLSIYNNSFGSLEIMKGILNSLETECSNMSNQGDNFQNHIKKGGKLKTIGNAISLGSGIASIFFPPVSVVTICSLVGGLVLDFTTKRTTDQNKKTIEKTINTIKGCIEDLNESNKKVETSVNFLKEKFEMTDDDIEYFQNLCLVAHVVNMNNPMDKGILAVILLKLIELQQTNRSDEKYQQHFETSCQFKQEESNKNFKPPSGIHCIPTIVQTYYQTTETIKQTITISKKFAPGIGRKLVVVTQGVQSYAATIILATRVLQGLTIIFDIFSFKFSVADWLYGDEKMKEEVEKQVSEFRLMTNEIRTTYEGLEKFVKSIEDQKSIIDLQLFNVVIYNQIMNIYPKSENIFRLINEYKHIIGFKYKYMEKQLILNHFRILLNISNSTLENENNILRSRLRLKVLINEINNVNI